MNTPIFKQDEQGIAIEKIMDEHVPGWRNRKLDFGTFAEFCQWIDDCVRGILTQESGKENH